VEFRHPPILCHTATTDQGRLLGRFRPLSKASGPATGSSNGFHHKSNSLAVVDSAGIQASLDGVGGTWFCVVLNGVLSGPKPSGDRQPSCARRRPSWLSIAKERRSMSVETHDPDEAKRGPFGASSASHTK
jgi:hypothetical protein